VVAGELLEVGQELLEVEVEVEELLGEVIGVAKGGGIEEEVVDGGVIEDGVIRIITIIGTRITIRIITMDQIFLKVASRTVALSATHASMVMRAVVMFNLKSVRIIATPTICYNFMSKNFITYLCNKN
jgi:hypothetical protein